MDKDLITSAEAIKRADTCNYTKIDADVAWVIRKINKITTHDAYTREFQLPESVSYNEVINMLMGKGWKLKFTEYKRVNTSEQYRYSDVMRYEHYKIWTISW